MRCLWLHTCIPAGGGGSNPTHALKVSVVKQEKNSNMGNPNPPNQWKPGQSGNPKGRPPKGYSITEMVRTLIETPYKDPKTGQVVDLREAIGLKIIDKAMQGDTAAQKMIWQYMDGMPKQRVQVDTNVAVKESEMALRVMAEAMAMAAALPESTDNDTTD